VRTFSFVMGVAASIGILSAQSAKPAATKAAATKWTPARTPDGQPDVQGVWVTAVYGMGCLSNPKSGPGCKDEDTGRNRDRQPQPNAASRVIDTPDGEIPYLPAARQRQQYLLSNYFEPTKPEFIDPQQRCFPLGAVRQITWHDIQILQYPGYVVFVHEGGHVYRIIPLDGHPHVGQNIKLWMGDSRGHWEGNTLVVDVTNSNSKGRLSRSGDFASDQVHNTERFQFIDADTARYEAVFDDPSVYTKPWTFGLDLKRGIFAGEGGGGEPDAHYEQWEEACHEGMHDELDGSLRSAGAVSEKK
jgi:hypothetical protein